MAGDSSECPSEGVVELDDPGLDARSPRDPADLRVADEYAGVRVRLFTSWSWRSWLLDRLDHPFRNPLDGLRVFAQEAATLVCFKSRGWDSKRLPDL